MKEANREVLDTGSLPELLAHRARNASDKRLVLDAAAGLVLAAGVVALRPPLWVPLAALAFALGAFGLWGILDRETHDAPARRVRVISTVRSFIALSGAASAVLGGLSLFFLLLGTWIS